MCKTTYGAKNNCDSMEIGWTHRQKDILKNSYVDEGTKIDSCFCHLWNPDKFISTLALNLWKCSLCMNSNISEFIHEIFVLGFGRR